MNATQNGELVEAKTRLTNAQADMKEFQYAVLRKEYVKRDDVSRTWTEQAGRVRSRLLSLPVRLAGMLAGAEYAAPEIEGITQKLVNEALSELAEDYAEQEEK